MRVSCCPYCKGPLPKSLDIPQMSQRQLRIYRAVCAAGRDGISPKDLIAAMYDGQAPMPSAYGMLRVQIHYINRIIAGQQQRISAEVRGSYQLIGREQWQDH